MSSPILQNILTSSVSSYELKQSKPLKKIVVEDDANALPMEITPSTCFPSPTSSQAVPPSCEEIEPSTYFPSPGSMLSLPPFSRGARGSPTHDFSDMKKNQKEAQQGCILANFALKLHIQSTPRYANSPSFSSHNRSTPFSYFESNHDDT